MPTKRDYRFGLMLSDEERDGLYRLADYEGLSAASVLRRLLMKAVHELDHRSFRTGEAMGHRALNEEPNGHGYPVERDGLRTPKNRYGI